MGRESAASSDRSVFYAGDAQTGKAGTDRRAERSAGRDTGQLWKRQIYRSRSQKKNGMPMLKQKNGDAYQPIFTDIRSFENSIKRISFKDNGY